MKDRLLLMASLIVAAAVLGLCVWGVAEKRSRTGGIHAAGKETASATTETPSGTGRTFKRPAPAETGEERATRQEQARALRGVNTRHLLHSWLQAERNGREQLAEAYRKTLLKKGVSKSILEAELESAADEATRELVAGLIEEVTR